MNIHDIIFRNPAPLPWEEEEKIPWNEAGFSRRMLREHLSQEHDLASRRSTIIDQHVAWIEKEILQGRQANILDLGCGPGLYANRLAALGHTCTGIDFSPASIEYARQHSHINTRFLEADVRTVNLGKGYDLAMMLYGEFNVFRPEEARLILQKAFTALVEGGILLLEVHTLDCVRRLGQAPVTWHSAEQGVFADNPYVCLMENFWDEQQKVAMERFFILEEGRDEVKRYGQSIQGYADNGYRHNIQACGYHEIQFYPSLYGTGKLGTSDLFVIKALK